MSAAFTSGRRSSGVPFHLRLSLLVALGFVGILGIDMLTTGSIIAGLEAAMARAQASQSAALKLRASVRSLRADFLEEARVTSSILLDPSRAAGGSVKRTVDAASDAHLVAARLATTRADLLAALDRLEVYDRRVTDRLEAVVQGLAASDPERARRLYFTKYEPALRRTLGFVDAALELASAEVAATARDAEQIAADTVATAERSRALFLAVGLLVAVGLAAAVGRLGLRVERAARDLAVARDAALEGSRTKDEFLANVSHEIRTPMNVIVGYVDIVLGSEPTPDQRHCLDRIRTAAIALLDIINDILDISKIEAGKLSVEQVPFAVRAMLDDAVQPLAPAAYDKGLALVVEVAADVPEAMVGDPTRLRQVLLNLASNAIKFTPSGQVTVQVAWEPHGGEPGTRLHLVVTDTGIGISPDKRDAIFESFTQADGSMARRYGGTGLGLAIVARLVALMAGKVWVESVEGKGSAFHVTLPMAASRQSAAA